MDFQATLFEAGPVTGPLDTLGEEVARVPLSHGAWVDLRPGWMHDADARRCPTPPSARLARRCQSTTDPSWARSS